MTKITDQPLDLGDHEHVTQRTSKLKAREQRAANDLRVVMSEPGGRRVMWGLLDRAGVYRISHTPGDPYQTAFNEGCRNFGLPLLNDLMRLCPTEYGQMLREAQEEQDG